MFLDDTFESRSCSHSRHALMYFHEPCHGSIIFLRRTGHFVAAFQFKLHLFLISHEHDMNLNMPLTRIACTTSHSSSTMTR